MLIFPEWIIQRGKHLTIPRSYVAYSIFIVAVIFISLLNLVLLMDFLFFSADETSMEMSFSLSLCSIPGRKWKCSLLMTLLPLLRGSPHHCIGYPGWRFVASEAESG